MDIIDESLASIQQLDISKWEGRVAALDILRLDKIHPQISGNKWYKLKSNLEVAIANGKDTLLTFGGAYSNHLLATAATAQAAGLKSVGIVRGLYAVNNLTPTLINCQALGMSLHFISREEYNLKANEGYLSQLSTQHPTAYIVPEGGANEAGRAGANTIATLIPAGYTHICLSVGTGTTLIGLRQALPDDVQVFGFVPMKAGKYIEDYIRSHVGGKPVTLYDDYHFGGFGKWNNELIHFMNDFYEVHRIPLDIVYTSKMMYGIDHFIKSGYFPKASRILSIHTGGLQGNSSVQHLLSF